jgi:predicted DNA-binding mobile mystery protein A
MAARFNRLQRELINKRIDNMRFSEIPSSGWIAAIRKSLGMTTAQMARRIGIAQQSASRLEQNEADGSITLKSLQKAAASLNCRLVYALIPNEGNLDTTLRKQATKKATKTVKATDHSMMLENQRVGSLDSKIKEKAKAIMLNPKSSMWDV